MATLQERTDIRLLISDTDAANQIFADDEIDRFFALRGDDVLRAAALALRTIAGNEAQRLKVIRLLDLDTDGAALSKELRALVADYETQAAEDEDITIAEYAGSPFGWHRRLTNEYLRSLEST